MTFGEMDDAGTADQICQNTKKGEEESPNSIRGNEKDEKTE